MRVCAVYVCCLYLFVWAGKISGRTARYPEAEAERVRGKITPSKSGQVYIYIYISMCILKRPIQLAKGMDGERSGRKGLLNSLCDICFVGSDFVHECCIPVKHLFFSGLMNWRKASQMISQIYIFSISYIIYWEKK